VLCSAGAGAKADPTRLRIIDISESSIDPLARAVRHKCARRAALGGATPPGRTHPHCHLTLPPLHPAHGPPSPAPPDAGSAGGGASAAASRC
jgi:hypothetical protein